jgi:hypothetical protein
MLEENFISARSFFLALPVTIGLGVVGKFENRPPTTEAQLKN